jgi:prepilin signal peptidase PulO-like enzyme (type II secretory pathway)
MPLISWLILRGRCRYCEKVISWQYPALELICALLFLLAPLSQGWLATGTYLVAVILLVAASVYDARWMELPDYFSWMLAGLAVIHVIALALSGGWLLLTINSLVGAAVGAGFFGLQYVASRGRWIGSGDIILGSSLGLLLGWPGILLALVVAYVTGGLAAVPLLIAKKRGWGSALAFGPFLAFGGLVALRFGTRLMEVLGWM